MPKNSKVDAVIAYVNKSMGSKGRAVIQKGSDIRWASATRLPTGSLGLDIALNGGLPKGMVTQFFGEESSCKTTMALKCAAIVQRLFDREAAIGWVSVEGFDKKWANQCGVQ